MGAHLPWYKRDVDAWRGGTRGMSLELRGFYSECLDAMWDRQGPIEKDVAKLAVLLCCNPRSVRKLLPQLIGLGKLIETDAGYVNPRMMTEMGLSEAVPMPRRRPAKAAQVQPELASNSAPIPRELGSKVPEKPLVSTRDLESESESDSDNPLTPIAPVARIDQVEKLKKELRLDGSDKRVVVSPEARRRVCERLGLVNADPLVDLFLGWSGASGAESPDALFVSLAPRMLRSASEAVRRACQGLEPVLAPTLAAAPAEAAPDAPDSRRAANERMWARHGLPSRTSTRTMQGVRRYGSTTV